MVWALPQLKLILPSEWSHRETKQPDWKGKRGENEHLEHLGMLWCTSEDYVGGDDESDVILVIWWGQLAGHHEDLRGCFVAFFHCGPGSSLDRWTQVIRECQTRWIGPRRKHDREEAGRDISRMQSSDFEFLMNLWISLRDREREIEGRIHTGYICMTATLV